MSGPLGAVAFEAMGKQWTMKLGTYGLALLQRNTGVPTMKFVQRDADAWGANDVLQVFVAGLHKHQLTEEEVADIMDDLGPERLSDVLQRALSASFGEAGKSKGNPQKAPETGTGNASSGNGLAAA